MKNRAKNNKTLTLSSEEECFYKRQLSLPENPLEIDRVYNEDLFNIAKYLPKKSVDLLILDPPYNLGKTFGKEVFRTLSSEDYSKYLIAVLDALTPSLKAEATVYTCGVWKMSASIQTALESKFYLKNRITWEREKGRGSKTNWKNSSEDIWYSTLGKSPTFNVETIKIRRKVLAPYKDKGVPKDWVASKEGNFRDTFPSNLITDVSVPFWSMPENTDHPTQKPEKLMAKLILASSNVGDLVLDPFLGSGTTAVVAKKLGRHYIGVEKDLEYCLWSLARLKKAEVGSPIQGYSDSIFWERNSNR